MKRLFQDRYGNLKDIRLSTFFPLQKGQTQGDTYVQRLPIYFPTWRPNMQL